jgi:uncharacterized membrane protein
MRQNADIQAPGNQPRRIVASFSTYREAEQAVDRLSDLEFPVERVTIVGRDLEFVEQVTGRMGYPQAALRGALTGAFVGFLVGWLFGVFDWTDPIVSAVWLALDGLWFGALVGALFGLLFHALLRGRRDFASFAAMKANRYDVLVDEQVADEAARLLGGKPQSSPASPPPTTNPVHGV